MANPVNSRDDDLMIYRRMTLYESVVFDVKRYVAAYHRHHADVRRYFAGRPHSLLEMNLVEGDGWETLCPFLGLPAPAVPFPHLNSRGEDGSRNEAFFKGLGHDVKMSQMLGSIDPDTIIIRS